MRERGRDKTGKRKEIVCPDGERGVMVVTARPILYGDSARIRDKGVRRHEGEELGAGRGGGQQQGCVSS